MDDPPVEQAIHKAFVAGFMNYSDLSCHDAVERTQHANDSIEDR
jgi:hypothetical protein